MRLALIIALLLSSLTCGGGDDPMDGPDIDEVCTWDESDWDECEWQ